MNSKTLTPAELKWQRAGNSVNKRAGYNSDIQFFTDAELTERLERGRTWIKANKKHRHLDFYKRRFLAIEEEIRLRRVAKQEAEDAAQIEAVTEVML
jgi:hypothetical protein